MEEDDIYDIEGYICRQLAYACITAWRLENEARCARIMGEFRPMPTIFYPLADRVLIKPEDMGGEKRSPSGLVIIPDLGKTRSNTGFILAIGPDCDGIELGDKVLFGKYAGSDIELNGEAVVICRMDDILGVITEEPDEGSIDESPDEPDPPA
jgi:chaperonin GroES